MAYNNAEDKLYTDIGRFSTIGQLINGTGDLIDFAGGVISSNFFPGQCQAFLTTSLEFIWFVEERDIIYKTPESPVETFPVSFGAKKVYPAKVNGLSLPLLHNSFYSTTVAATWRDELISGGNYSGSDSFSIQSGNFRPGFGELILSDLDRPQKSAVVQTNNLGLPNIAFSVNDPNNSGFTGPLGRLMSIASYVNPELAKRYDASKDKKKKKSLNEQTYQDPPEYPEYTPYPDDGGYGY